MRPAATAVITGTAQAPLWAAPGADNLHIVRPGNRGRAGQGSGRVGIRANTTENTIRDSNARLRCRAFSV